MPRRIDNSGANPHAGIATLAPGQGLREQRLRELGLCQPCVRRLATAGFTGDARHRLVCHDCERRRLGEKAFQLSIPTHREAA